MQGMFNERPTEPKYSEIWDIDQVLSYLESIELSNAVRAFDLHLLDVRYMQSQSDKVKFTIAGLSKTRRSGPPREVEYSRFADNLKLCPVTSLLSYVDRTKEKCTNKEFKLFLALKKPHMSVSTGTIFRWLKEMLRMAGINNYTAHSIRAASTSAARSKGISVRDILRTGNWSRESTFNRFYNKTIISSVENTAYTQMFSAKEQSR